MQTSKLVAIVAISLAIFLAASYFLAVNSPHYDSQNTPSAALLKTNEFYVSAQQAAQAGNYEQAKPLYEKALGEAVDNIQKGQIDFKLAFIEDRFGDPVKAIGMYKAIVASPDFNQYNIIKAYALQSMAELHYRDLSPAITAEIFKDAPYKSFKVEGNIPLTYRHLEEYATSFYALGLSELRIAEWYATNYTKASTPGGNATSTYPSLIKQAVDFADADVARTKDDPNASTLIPDILVRKEAVYARMYRNGLATAAETEKFCKDAIDIYTTKDLKYQDGFARYYYALFLSSQGASRAADLKAVLAPLETDPGYKGAYILDFFANGKKNPQQKTRLAMLAGKIPEFKTLLLSLGWTSADF